MSTPIAHAPTTQQWSLGQLGPWLAALAAIALAATVAVTLGTGSDQAVEPAVVFEDMTRSEVIERVERINGFTGTAAGTSAGAVSGPSTATDGAASSREQARSEVLEQLYRIDGVAPVAADVPAHVR